MDGNRGRLFIWLNDSLGERLRCIRLDGKAVLPDERPRYGDEFILLSDHEAALAKIRDERDALKQALKLHDEAGGEAEERILEAQRVAASGTRDRKQLLSAIKQHRNATKSRLRTVNGREASDTMLKPDRDLYKLADQIERQGEMA